MNSLALLGNAFGPDGIIIFLVILVFFGAKRLPELARGLGQAIKEFSRAKDDIQNELSRPPVVESSRHLAEYSTAHNPVQTPGEVHEGQTVPFQASTEVPAQVTPEGDDFHKASPTASTAPTV